MFRCVLWSISHRTPVCYPTVDDPIGAIWSLVIKLCLLSLDGGTLSDEFLFSKSLLDVTHKVLFCCEQHKQQHGIVFACG